jgi:hypothetical protein
MKTSLIKKLTRLPELTAAIAIISALVVATAAAEIPTGKGLAQLLTKPTPTVSGTAAPTSSCSSCQDVYVAHSDTTVRGVNKVQLRTARHLCQGCSTTLTSSGAGKAKLEVANHKCAMIVAQQVTSCCGTQNTSSAPGCGQK